MKKLLLFCIVALILVLKTSLVVADPNLCFDFDGDAVCDTSGDIDGTGTVEIYLDDWDTSPWPSEPIWGVQMFFYYDHTKIDLNIANSFPNDTIHGGPFDPTLSLPQSKGDGKYKLTASMGPQDCTAITDKILLWTLELAGLTSGTSDISIQVDFNGDPDHGAIFPGGVDCSGAHAEDGGDGQATIDVLLDDDADGDGVLDGDDNCPNHPNGPLRGTCTENISGEFIVSYIPPFCTTDEDCGGDKYCEMSQADNYPPTPNGIGDACDCEGNLNCDYSVDGLDVTLFLVDLNKRLSVSNPCTNLDPCNGDFDCDTSVLGDDALKFVEDWNKRLTIDNPCVPCDPGIPWCVY